MRRQLLALVAAAVALGGCNQEILGRFQTPPQAAITVPGDGEEISGLSATFAGTVTDGQDAAGDLAVTWLTSLSEEPLFEGFGDSTGFTTVTPASLPGGLQIITLRVIDADEMTDEDSIEVNVLPGAPVVAIELPEAGDHFVEGDPISFRGTATASAGGELDFLWVSTVDNVENLLEAGEMESGGITEFTAPLGPGFHTIRLEVTDAFGTLGVDDTVIQVEPAPVGSLDQDHDGFCPDGIDADGDGECDESEQTGAGSQDCDDQDPLTYPGAPEICDGKDNDCDFLLPEDEQDFDGDGWEPCAGDCDDTNQLMYPNNFELCDGLDNDCDGAIDETDLDVDGDGVTQCNGDCNDNNPAIYPNAPEVCDGLDNNCDGNIDENSTDLDGDGFAVCAGDCDDGNPTVYPNAPEVCDGLDNDCNGLVDETNVDADGDGVTSCAGDCNDNNGAMFPGNPEICDLLDNNCDGQIDELDVDADFDGVSVCSNDCDDSDPTNFPGNVEVCDDADNDCDGLADEHATNLDGDPADSCDGDCNDTNPTIYPGAPELCDGLDNDCNFQVPLDEYETDGDGQRPCAGDCDDTNPVMYTGNTEICDPYDNNCNGVVNENADPTELGESSSTAYGEALELPGFNHIIHFPPFQPCPGLTCDVFGGAITLCRNNISATGTFASAVDAFDAYVLDYDQLATTLGCEMTASLSNIPNGHDYALTLYKTSNINAPVSSWDLLQSSDNPGSQSEYLVQPATSLFNFGSDTFVLVVLSKGNWNCPSPGSYTLNVTGG